MAEIHVAVSPTQLDPAEALAFVSSTSCGGIATFIGTVRASAAADEHRGKPVEKLEYEAHPELADERLAAIAAGAAERWEVERIYAVHRTGACGLGEATVLIATAAPHRRDALEACRWIIDEVKDGVPIWKREVYADGSAWVGAGS
ncbi:MAG TPA: molybdenum cofactor biosynthesis protein MoaE [Actinomycetota bacterium]|nr:molybdenum cofactor biosynthesis protein MoaE [Actinomycetota bacterium]